jgi:hypothetical protein
LPRPGKIVNSADAYAVQMTGRSRC